MMNNREFQSTLSKSVSLHHAMKVSEMGKTYFDEWTKLVEAVREPAYNVFAATHDNAGMPKAIVDETALNEAYSVLSKILRPVIAYVGNVPFAGMEGEALLEVNRSMMNLVSNIAWKFGWKYSDEAQDIIDEISDKKDDLAIAQKWFEYYNWNGVDEALKARKAEAVAVLESEIAKLNEQRKKAEDKENGKVQIPVAKDCNPFRKDFENILNGLINGRKQESFADYDARMKAKKAKKNAKTAERRKAKKALQEQAEQDKAKAEANK